jgi:hypothetical protein
MKAVIVFDLEKSEENLSVIPEVGTGRIAPIVIEHLTRLDEIFKLNDFPSFTEKIDLFTQ